MPTQLVDTQQELDSVRHLRELGYEDPLDVAARHHAEDARREDRCRDAQSLLASGRSGEAIRLLEQLRNDAPDWPPPRVLLARAFYAAARYDAARAELQWLAYHGIETAQLALLRAAVELAQRQFDAALDQAAYALCLDRALGGANVVIGQVHQRRGNLAAAEAAYRRELALRPTDTTALAGMAAIALRRGDDEQAADWALGALEQNLNLPAVHCRLGVALMRLGRIREAVTAWETAAKLHPHLVAPFRYLERISQEEFRDGDRARKYRLEALERLGRRRQQRKRRS